MACFVHSVQHNGTDLKYCKQVSQTETTDLFFLATSWKWHSSKLQNCLLCLSSLRRSRDVTTNIYDFNILNSVFYLFVLFIYLSYIFILYICLFILIYLFIIFRLPPSAFRLPPSPSASRRPHPPSISSFYRHPFCSLSQDYQTYEINVLYG